MDGKKICSMIEIKQDTPHTPDDHDFHCACSECGTSITASADFDNNGRLLKVRFPICYCPNCKADIEQFIQYHGE